MKHVPLFTMLAACAIAPPPVDPPAMWAKPSVERDCAAVCAGESGDAGVRCLDWCQRGPITCVVGLTEDQEPAPTTSLIVPAIGIFGVIVGTWMMTAAQR